ncbi:hypothetical protein EDD66_11266 [Mobilisporobacter senegalensis]|uniref:Uncharacterized protein n=1 Tax=Mobilisporobacter senegalensis TaxID=1329262 RepID=A0A3N1XB44_9FIRM|nr:DUF6179 domain-containing protein [Mobilisporobacter senegalensis]ROR23935.1 hypothetical protein EDD66_11266 [Mobilisporobacter senegalensis]
MEYSMEELLPLVEELTRKYTSNESSSVTYETARVLMGAVLYCIEECYNNGGNGLAANEKMDAQTAYRRGYDLIVEKVYKAKEIYESILEDFCDFQCRICRDTIITAIPKFFVMYDPKFNPQNHILTLDYPTVIPINALCGVNAIYQYLCNIKIEWEFLNAFHRIDVKNLLERIVDDYQNLYCDNISNEVLLTALGCMIVEKPVGKLELQKNDINFIQSYFENDRKEKAEEKIRKLISDLFGIGYHGNREMETYFLNISNDYAVRIINGIQNHSLNRVFHLCDIVGYNE